MQFSHYTIFTIAHSLEKATGGGVKVMLEIMLCPDKGMWADRNIRLRSTDIIQYYFLLISPSPLKNDPAEIRKQ